MELAQVQNRFASAVAGAAEELERNWLPRSVSGSFVAVAHMPRNTVEVNGDLLDMEINIVEYDGLPYMVGPSRIVTQNGDKLEIKAK